MTRQEKLTEAVHGSSAFSSRCNKLDTVPRLGSFSNFRLKGWWRFNLLKDFCSKSSIKQISHHCWMVLVSLSVKPFVHTNFPFSVWTKSSRPAAASWPSFGRGSAEPRASSRRPTRLWPIQADPDLLIDRINLIRFSYFERLFFTLFALYDVESRYFRIEQIMA